MENIIQEKSRIKKPKWLRVKLPTGENYKNVRRLVDEHKLNTICEHNFTFTAYVQRSLRTAKCELRIARSS